MMEPRHARIDALPLVIDHLRAVLPDCPVVAATDAMLDPSERALTVVQVPEVRTADTVTVRRWSFVATVTLITYAGDYAQALATHSRVADAILDLTSLDGGAVRVSSVRSIQEPEDVPVRSATDWPGQLSSYTIYLRRED